MKNLNKIFFGLSALMLTATNVHAQNADDPLLNLGNRAGIFDQQPSINPIFVEKPQVVLFKIHDIKPVVGPDGEVTACDYVATFFNRTPVNIRQAKIKLGWSDLISERYPIEGEMPAAENNETNDASVEEERAPQTQMPSETEDNLGTFVSVINIPALGSLKQVSVQGRVETDKCFALFDNIKFSVPVCNILSNQDNLMDTRRGRLNADKDQLSCAALFAYVNSKHPEYYSEFSQMSYEEQIQHEKTQEEKEKEMIATITQDISKSFKNTDNILDAIK